MLKKILLGATVLSAAACGVDDASTNDVSVDEKLAAINLEPASLADAQRSLGDVDALLRATNNDARVMKAAHALSEKMDLLNGLVETVKVGDRTLAFFRADDGSLTVSDSGPRQTESMLDRQELRDLSVADLFRAVAPNRAIPRQLVEVVAAAPDAEAVSADSGPTSGPATIPAGLRTDRAAEIDVAQSALTGSDADAMWFRANRCPTGGAGGSYCYVQWWNGGWANNASFRYSQFNIAPFAGNVLNVVQTTDGKFKGSFAVFTGEDRKFKSQGPNISVQDSGCCWICACGTHPDIKKVRHQWEITNASGDGFHWGGNWSN